MKLRKLTENMSIEVSSLNTNCVQLLCKLYPESRRYIATRESHFRMHDSRKICKFQTTRSMQAIANSHVTTTCSSNVFHSGSEEGKSQQDISARCVGWEQHCTLLLKCTFERHQWEHLWDIKMY
jgi:hypothetical protein